MTEPVPPLTTIVPDLSSALSAVVMRALERAPDARFSTCAQFADALEAAATGTERIATPRELAAYVTEVLGEEVSAQREAVRAWIARSEPSQVGLSPNGVGSSSVSAAAMSLSGPDLSQPATVTQGQPPKGRSPALLFALVLVLLVAVGGGSFLFARRTGPHRAAAAASQPPAPLPVATVPASPSAPVAAVEPVTPVPSVLPPESTPAAKPIVQQRPRATGKAADTIGAVKKSKKRVDDVDLRNPYR
jgi:serine/threonine-protein kinase